MEQSLRLILTGETAVLEQTLLNIYNKIYSAGQAQFAPDLYVLTAERLLELPPPLQKHILQKSESMIRMYNRLQEPENQFRIRSRICQAIIDSQRAKQLRGIEAAELNLKAVDNLYRCFQQIQANNLYLPLALRTSFIFYQIASPFFITVHRHYLANITPIVLSLLETHLTKQFDSTLRLYIAISLLHCCILDDFSKSDEAVKQMMKIFTLVPTDLIQLRYSLLHLLTHFSRKSSGGLLKQKFDLNEQLQKAVIMYQTARSNNATTTKDLAEVLKTCQAFIESKKEPNEEYYVAEIVIGETGRLAAQFNQMQLAEECLAKASTARSPIARIHGILISAEIAFTKSLSPNEKSEIINSCNHAMSLAMYQGDLVIVQDAAALLWSHCIQMIDDHPAMIKRFLVSASDMLSKVNSQANILRSQMYFAIANIYIKERDNNRALDNLKKAIALDYFCSDHPSKLIHPYDRFIVPLYRILSVKHDSYGQQTNVPDEAYAQIAIPKKVNPESIDSAFKIIKSISPSSVAGFDSLDSAHFAAIWHEIIKCASTNNIHSVAFEGCKQLLSYDFDPAIHDATVETQCEAAVYGITSAFKVESPQNESAINFVQFVITKAKLLKKNRLSYNAISAIWNSFFALQDPANCNEFCDFIFDIVNNLFESDFKKSEELIGQFVNFYVQIVMNPSAESQQVSTPKKNKPTVDQAKQKQLKSAEDLLVKSLPVITSIYEKKALVDRLVDIFSKRNALPPNQSDPELSVLVQLATILNDKVQHKSETLASLFTQIQQMKQPMLYSLLADKACKLEVHQISIDSATKAIEMFDCNTKGKDELYHLGLAHFYRGLSYLKLIQPELQEFSCQDKLRFDLSTDLLQASKKFKEAGSMNNAKLSLAYFVSTVSVGENYPHFRSLLLQTLPEAITLSKSVIIGDELRVRLFRIYLLVLIDQKDWPLCKKTIQAAISQLNKNVIGHIWELNLIVTFNSDCSVNQQPLIDEMLRVKQLGDTLYQSKLWTFVADLSTDRSIQQSSLKKAIDVIKPEDITYKFRAHMNYARWLYQNQFSWSEIENAVKNAENLIQDQPEEFKIECKLEILAFKLETTTDIDSFNQLSKNVIDISQSLWILTVASNTSEEDDQKEPSNKRNVSSRSRPNQHKSQSSLNDNIDQFPQTNEEWIQLLQNIDKHKPFQVLNAFRFVSNLLEIIEILENVGYNFYLFNFWLHLLLFVKQVLQWPRYEQYAYMRLAIFLDKLNIVSPFTYSTDYLLTEAEKTEWEQQFRRYLNEEPGSSLIPLRKLLNMQAKLLILQGEYKNALYIINSALAMAQQINDTTTMAESVLLVATIKSRSGDTKAAIETLTQSGQTIGKGNIEFWSEWFSAAFSTGENETSSNFIEPLIAQFQQNCLSNDAVLPICEIMSVYKLYRNAAPHMSPETAYSFYENVLKGKMLPIEKFLPTIDTLLSFWWRSLLNSKFPDSLDKYQEFGNELLKLINVSSNLYNHIADSNEHAALPFLCRLIDSVNLFGYYVLKSLPKVHRIEKNKLNNQATCDDASLVLDILQQNDDPFPDLSTTAAVMFFNNVKNIDNIPNKYCAPMNVFLGQCLHSISVDNVTLQSAVKCLWDGNNLLTEMKEYDLIGEIAQELYSILRSSDASGAIYQLLIAQSVKAYRKRISQLYTQYPSSNRERLFIHEMQRLKDAFLNPQISPMYQSCEKYFEVIPNGTSLVRLGRSFDEIRQWVTDNKNCLIILIDNLTDEETNTVTITSITFGSFDVFSNVDIEINLAEAAMKYEIFKQIISTVKEEVPVSPTTTDQKATAPANTATHAKPPKATKRTGSKMAATTATTTKTEEKSTSFAKEALKLNNPEFQSYIDDLNKAFEPVSSILPETCPETVIILSTQDQVHTIPLECVTAFANFQTIYHDFSIMAALNRKVALTTAPTFGDATQK